GGARPVTDRGQRARPPLRGGQPGLRAVVPRAAPDPEQPAHPGPGPGRAPLRAHGSATGLPQLGPPTGGCRTSWPGRLLVVATPGVAPVAGAGRLVAGRLRPGGGA